MKSKPILIAVAIIVLIAGIFVFKGINGLSQEDILKQEIANLSGKDELGDDYTNIEIKTKDEYAEIEKAIKNYMKDYSEIVKNTLKLLNSEEFTNILTINNYKNDGPEFKASKELIKKESTEFEENINKLEEMSNEEKIMSYINNDLEETYKNLYKNLLLVALDLNNYEEIKTYYDTEEKIIKNTINVTEETINYLQQKKQKWRIDNNTIVFDTDEQLDEFNKLIEKIVIKVD